MAVYANYFYDTSVIFSNSIITYRETFTICIGHDRRTDVIGIDWEMGELANSRLGESVSDLCRVIQSCIIIQLSNERGIIHKPVMTQAMKNE